MHTPIQSTTHMHAELSFSLSRAVAASRSLALWYEIDWNILTAAIAACSVFTALDSEEEHCSVFCVAIHIRNNTPASNNK